MDRIVIAVIGGVLLCWGGIKMSNLPTFSNYTESIRSTYASENVPFKEDEFRTAFEANREQAVFNARAAIGAGILCILGALL